MAVEMWESELFRGIPGCASGVSRRIAGASAPPFESLNLGLHVGDDRETVVANRKIAAGRLGFEIGDMVCAEQVHGGGAAAVDRTFRGRGATHSVEALPDIDALVTDSPGVLLTLFFADCIPVLLADTQKCVVAVAHAGWRGIVAGVVENTVEKMVDGFGALPQDIAAAIGPGIGNCCFEVGDEVAARFPPDCVRRAEGQPSLRVDLKSAIAIRLSDCGINNIDVSDECTSCLPDKYFSYRRDAGRTGRMAAMIGLIAECRES